MQVLKYSQPRWRRAAATGLRSETDERYLTYKHSKAVAKAGYCRSRHFLPKAERPKDRWSSARLLLGFAVRLTRAAPVAGDSGSAGAWVVWRGVALDAAAAWGESNFASTVPVGREYESNSPFILFSKDFQLVLSGSMFCLCIVWRISSVCHLSTHQDKCKYQLNLKSKTVCSLYFFVF